jgi:hypothetical protein
VSCLCGNLHIQKKADAIKTRRLEIHSFNNTDDDYTEDNTNDDLYAILLDDFLKEYRKDINAAVAEIKVYRVTVVVIGTCRGCSSKSISIFQKNRPKSRSLVSNGVDGGNRGELSVTILKVIEEE